MKFLLQQCNNKKFVLLKITDYILQLFKEKYENIIKSIHFEHLT